MFLYVFFSIVCGFGGPRPKANSVWGALAWKSLGTPALVCHLSHCTVLDSLWHCSPRQFVLAVKCLQHLSKCCFFDGIKGLHLFSDVVNYTVCECAPFCTVLFLFCLMTKHPRDCGLLGRRRRPLCSFSCSFFPSWENCIRSLCFRYRCMFVVLPLLAATVLQQMQYTSLSRLPSCQDICHLNYFIIICGSK